MEILEDLWEIKWPLLIVGGIIVLLVWVAVEAEKEWQQFAKEHHCVKVGEISPSSAISSDGKVVSIPGKEGFKCDDGVTYWR